MKFYHLLLFYGDFLIDAVYEATQFHYLTSRSYTSCNELGNVKCGIFGHLCDVFGLTTPIAYPWPAVGARPWNHWYPVPTSGTLQIES